MGFNKCLVSSEEQVRKMIQEKGSESVAKSFLRCDCFIGNPEGIGLINNIVEEYLFKNEPRAPEPGQDIYKL